MAATDFVPMLRKIIGGESQRSFARRLGTSQPGLSKILSGDRGPGRAILARLIREFPEHQEAILDWMISSVGDERGGAPLGVILWLLVTATLLAAGIILAARGM
jgi:transcriptional regulator with XRE-family HTH domain